MIHIADNNLFRQMSRTGNAHLFDKYYNFLLDQEIVGNETKWAITIGGLLEYLGMEIPPVEIDEAKYKKEVAEICKRTPVDHNEIDRIRNTMALDYEKALFETGLFSKKKISQRMALQMGYTDPKVQWVIEGIFKQYTTLEARKSICNRTGWDRSYAFQWPEELRGDVFATYLRDLHYMCEHKISFPSSRALRLIWASMKPIMMTEFVTSFRRGPISYEIFERNINLVSKALALDNQADYLDIEAIHGLTAGIYSSAKLYGVVFSTCDPIDNFLIRLGIYNSLIHHASKMPCEDPEWALTVTPGLGLVFDYNMDLHYEVWVADIAPLVDMLYVLDLEEWLNSYKVRFRYQGQGVGLGFDNL